MTAGLGVRFDVACDDGKKKLFFVNCGAEDIEREFRHNDISVNDGIAPQHLCQLA